MCLSITGKSTSRYHRIHSTDTLDLAPRVRTIATPPAPTRPLISSMGAPSPASPSVNGSSAAMSQSPFSIQHERLILELLPFRDSTKFHEWLYGGTVKGSWTEFHRSFLTRVPAGHSEPDKAKTAQAVKDAINSRSQKFLVYHPDKTNWSPEDHHVRFIVTVIQDNMLFSLWSESEWKKRNVEIAKAVYEVLAFLKASYYAADQNPPGYSQ